MSLRSLCFVFFLTLLFSPSLSVAQDEETVVLASMDDYSTTEKVGFAFYHLTGHTLPYDEWIFGSEEYITAIGTRQTEIRDYQRRRLVAGFQAFRVHEDTISIPTTARVRAIDNPDYATDPRAQDLGYTKMLEITLEATSYGAVYFPVMVGNLWVAVLPGSLEKKVKYGISEVNLERLRARLQKGALDGAGKVPVELVLLPTSADSENPMMAGDTPLWLLMADVGSISLIDTTGRPAWTESSDWFSSEARSELLGLQR